MLAVITMLVDRGAAETAHAKQMIVLELLEAANPAPPATINAAVDSRTVEILDVLNISGIPFDMCNSTGETVLHLAAKKHLPKVLDRLLSTGMCSTSKLCTAHRPPLYWAILHKSKKMIKAFVTFNPNIIQELEADAQEQILKAFEIAGFTDSPFDQFCQSLSAASPLKKDTLALACKAKAPAQVKHLVEGCGPSLLTPGLNIAVQNGQEEVVEILLSSCKDLTIPDDTLHMASKLADIRVATNIAKLLLKAGARADAVNEKLDQALHESCRRKGGKMLVSMLLTAGGNASAINAQGHTPLHISAFTGDVEITQELLCHLCQDPGINTHPLGPENQTPLHIAVSKGHVKCASLLATSKLIDVCARTSAGKTAFELSVTKGSAAITSMLVRAGGANLPLSEMQRIIQIIQSREIKPEDYDLLLALDAATDMATLETSVTPAFPVRQLEQTDSAVGAACMICLETMAASHSVSVLPCKHHFHSDCITEYLRTKIRSKVCPCCSHNLAAGDV